MTAVTRDETHADVLHELGRARDLVTPAIRAAVGRLDEHSRLVASYHLGWCDRSGRPTNANQGKAVRPGVVLLAAEAVGSTTEAAVPGAVAVELVHNFSLVHDDLMDRDAERRHRPTVWAVWGDATAVLVGDAMISLAHEVLEDLATPAAAAAAHALTLATRRLIHGQVLDVAFEQRNDVGLDECLEMAAGKTGSLLAASAEVGALLGGADAEVAAAFEAYGDQIGLAFQLVDDLLGIWGRPERTGKPVFSDLRSRKKTLPVVWTLTCGHAAGRELADWMADPVDHDEADLRHAAELIERAGGRAWAVAEAERRVRRALTALEETGVPPSARGALEDLAHYLVGRDM